MSRFFIKTIAATAGNVVYSIQPGTGRRWKVHAFRVTLTCDATVANRIMRTRLYDSPATGNEVGTPISGATTVASNSSTLSAGQMTPGTGASVADTAAIYLSNPIVLDISQSLSFQVVNGVAGDSYSGYAKIEEEPTEGP